MSPEQGKSLTCSVGTRLGVPVKGQEKLAFDLAAQVSPLDGGATPAKPQEVRQQSIWVAHKDISTTQGATAQVSTRLTDPVHTFGQDEN